MFQITNLINPNSWISFFYPLPCCMHLPSLFFFLLETYTLISSTFQTDLPTNLIPSTNHQLRSPLNFTIKLLDKAIYINYPHFSPQIHSLMIYNLASPSLNFTKTLLSKDTKFPNYPNKQYSLSYHPNQPLYSFKWHCQLETSTPFLQT